MEDVIKTVKKLKEMTEGFERMGSEVEAQAFAAMYQRLMLKHKIDLTDLEFAELDTNDPVEQHWMDYKLYPDVKLVRRRVSWSETLGHIVAKAHSCRTLVYEGSSRITFVGRRSDIQVAEWMFITLHRSLTKLADAAYAEFSTESVKMCLYCGKDKKAHAPGSMMGRNHPFKPNWERARGFRPSFIQSFIMRLYERYEREKNQIVAESTSTALVRIKGMEKAVDEFLEARKVKDASQLQSRREFNMEGVIRGQAAADKVNLRSNALDGEDRQKLGS